MTLDRALLLVQAAAYLTGLPAVGFIRWRPPGLSGAWAWTGLTFLGPVWASTAFVQVPLYEALERQPDPALVASNWSGPSAGRPGQPFSAGRWFA